MTKEKVKAWLDTQVDAYNMASSVATLYDDEGNEAVYNFDAHGNGTMHIAQGGFNLLADSIGAEVAVDTYEDDDGINIKNSFVYRGIKFYTWSFKRR